MTIKVKLDGDWDKFHAWALAAQGNFARASRKAIRRASFSAMSRITRRIKTGKYKKLAPLTLLMRQMDNYSNTPLFKTGQLARSITSDLVSDFMGQVGVLKQAKSSSGNEMANIALLLHNGGVIRITPKMRQAFARKLHIMAKKRGVSLLGGRGSKKGRIRIPPRRYIQEVFEDPVFIAKAQEIFRQTMKEELGF